MIYHIFLTKWTMLQPKIRPFKFLLADNYKRPEDSRRWIAETLRYRGEPDLATEIEAWQLPTLPVNGHELIAAGCPKGKFMSLAFAKLREAWKESDFKAGKEELLGRLPEVVREIEENGSPDLRPREKKKQKARLRKS